MLCIVQRIDNLDIEKYINYTEFKEKELNVLSIYS